MSRHRREMEVTSLRYTTDVIDDTFDDGTPLSDTLMGLLLKRYNVDKIPKITVVKQDGLYFSLDNRRLWVFKEYAKILQERENVILQVPVKFGPSKSLDPREMTTTTEGEDVKLKQKGSTKAFSNIKYISLSKIRYSTDLLCRYSRSGGLYPPSTIEEEFERFSSAKPFKFPVLKVVQRKGNYYALENRQLWLVKKWFQNIFDWVDNEVINDVIKVEVRPYGELPGHLRIENDGQIVHLIQKEPKQRRAKLKPIIVDGDLEDLLNVDEQSD